MPKIVLNGRTPDERVPELVVYATDAGLEPITSARVDDKGSFKLPDDALEKATYVAIGPAAEKKVERLSRDEVILYRSHQFAELLHSADAIELARARWERLLVFRHCVTGHVRWCGWRHPWFDTLVAPNFPARAAAAAYANPLAGGAATAMFRPELDLAILPLRRCRPVCEGVVEVYTRRCCWRPIVVFDPRIEEIIEQLEHIPIPIPDPDPGPLGPGSVGPDPVPFLEGGVPDRLALNAARDRVALRALPPAERVAYIEARPYLLSLFRCGTPRPVGSGFIGPDGEFQVCWRRFPTILLPHCRDEVAYVVKQLIDGVTVTIYDGVAAGRWFGLNESPTLTTYHPRAIACRGGDDPPLPGAVAFLELIGDTGSHDLESPAPDGWDRVSAPAFNSGLLYPVPTAAAAKGLLRNCNLGGVVSLLYRFSEGLRGVGARYYRLTVQQANAAGDPVPGTSQRIGPSGGRWRKFRFSGGSIQVLNVPLAAPPVASGETDLWTIPFDADLPSNEEWLANQYHGQLDTTTFPNGRHLLTVEIFDSNGNRLRPTGAGGAGTDTPFTYHLWQKSGATDVFPNVPFAGLTHILWWDNRAGTGDIEGVQVSGSPVPVGTCLFLSGPSTAELRVRYRAYHPEEMFLQRYSLTCYRGLEGAVQAPPTIVNGVLPVADATANAGTPPSAAALSTGVPFSALLGSHTRCSFAVNLITSLKTTNGSDFLHQGNLRDTVAFALEIT
ncbi:MAG: enoyl-CoA hydratase/isomerase family protein [Acidobacteria bacterium]|nr:enoyl-CoA hydratase/isomerase family protein [Acidobacteriota bacterium]